MTAPVLQHVALSVRDIDASADWYARLFDQDPDVDREPFSQKHVGLDHVAFVCQDRDELDAWAEKLAEHDVDRSPVEESPFGWHLNFRDPDGITLEFYLPAAG